MSRPNRPQRRIQGPQSALTDFLASHNISAQQIRLDAEARRRAAEAETETPAAPQDEQVTEAATASTSTGDGVSTERTSRAQTTVVAGAESAKRKKAQAAVAKIKAKKKAQKRKRGEDDSDGSEYDDLAEAIFQRSAPLPGQMENCAVCGKRFTVTAYSRSAPDGGLLCNPCGKELDKEEAAPKKRAKRVPGVISGRRQVQSKILDGTYRPGAKSLMTLCIETLAKNINLADDLGELPVTAVDKIARNLSKNRLIDARTLDLFLQPTVEDLFIYDGSKLGADDYIRIFQTAAKLKRLRVCNGVHFKDEVMDYLLSRHIQLEYFYLHGANLLAEEKWKEFLVQKGQSLTTLKVYWTDKHFTDEVLALLEKHCPSLTRLKVEHNQRVTGEGVKAIANIKSLRHLGLDLREHVHSDVYVHLLGKIGQDLETLSLARVPDADNSILDALHNKCRSLRKLRITDSEVMTDEGFARLFKDWGNRELKFIDFQKCRQLESTQPRENPDGIGLCSNGFRALMAHSGRTLEYLNLYGCRHISPEAFEEVFGADKVYPSLTKLEISFCEQVTDFIVGSIFRSCPQLRELIVFGCMKVKDVKVPHGKLLVGVPNAVGMVIDGDDN
ncbi:hypothetical protein QBC47DRAFT_15954 [Echria macrotheca]|uniref:DNA repair protein rhp7 treble clef domain-containing protein n=1 Tax=Echria macrotheca TaxID=438768 RepID=A0AAJ0FA19_9PEZI|nr:hypothetical protein QBC47DRAFT_15954 [Echria macrotheca]